MRSNSIFEISARLNQLFLSLGFVVLLSSCAEGVYDISQDEKADNSTNNVPPQLVNNRLSIADGQAIMLSSNELSADDADNDNASLQFTISAITNGWFEAVSNAGVPITSFTQARIAASGIKFVHDGSNLAPTYSVEVSDGQLANAGGAQAANIAFSASVNASPILGNNRLTISEAQAVVLGSANLSADDVDNNNAGLLFTASMVVNGQFELVSAPGTAITSFNQAQITANAVQFVHSGVEAAPAYLIEVSDGTTRNIEGPLDAIITFTNTNDNPLLITNNLTVDEGITVILDGNNLSANDPDNDNGELTFSVSAINNGRFERNSAMGTAITLFRQSEIDIGSIRFVHDGSEIAPQYSVQVSDGVASNLGGPQQAAVTFSANVNDPPVLANNSLNIVEGQSVVLSGANLSADDVDNDNATLSFNITSIANGRFERSSAPGTAIVQFNQNEIGAGLIQFVHDGSQLAPSYDVEVSDGATTNTGGPQPANIGFGATVNDAPELVNNRLTIYEEQTIALSSSELSANDIDNDNAALNFYISAVTGGQFERVNASGTAITQFSQSEISDNNIQFVHDGGENAPGYDVAVSDGLLSNIEGPLAAAVNFTNINDAPSITNNSLSVDEGQTVSLTSADLSADDPDNDNALLIFTIGNAVHGQFEAVSAPGAAISQFNQSDITGNNIQFVHDGTESAPGYTVMVSDGAASNLSGPQAASIVFSANSNDPPQLNNNSLTVNEGQTVLISSNELSASDPDSPVAALIFLISSVSNGQFEHLTNPGVAISDFTQAQITANVIQFVHDGSEIAPSFSVDVSDGSVTNIGGPQAANITFSANVNDNPILINNSLTISEGEATILAGTNFSADDVDNDNAGLTFLISSVNYGRFELVTNPGAAITEFTQAQLVANAIKFVHDGGEAAPSYNVEVSDGSDTNVEGPLAASVTFTNVNDSPVFNFTVPAIITNNDGDEASIDVSATDADTSDTLIYTATSLPPGVFIDTSGAISGTIGVGAYVNSPYEVEVTVDDQNNQPNSTMTISFQWVVNPLPLTTLFSTTNSDLQSCMDALAAANGWTLANHVTGLFVCDNMTNGNLTGMGFLVNLSGFQAINSNITDLSPLSNLSSLTALYLSNNNPTGGTTFNSTLKNVLRNLNLLTDLWLKGNSITDLSGLASPDGSLINTPLLQDLRLAYNSGISDFTPLAWLDQLTYLDLTNTGISDVSVLSNKPLVTLILDGNQIQDVTPLGSLTALETLHLSNNQITNVNSLASLVNLITLDLQGNQIGFGVQGYVESLAALTSATVNLTNNSSISCGELQLLTNSPVKPVIVPGTTCTELPADPDKTTASIIIPTDPLVKGGRVTIWIQARDVYGNPKTQGGDRVDIIITGANPHTFSTSLPLPDYIEDHSNGAYAKVFWVFNAGTDTIEIKLGDPGQPINGDGNNGIYTLNTNTPPTAAIIQPSDNYINVWTGTQLTFEATAADAEDTIDQMALLWVFDGGDISSATTLGPHTIAFATPGAYTISFTATDSAGTSSTIQEKRIVVGDPWGASQPELIESIDNSNALSLKIAIDGADNVIAAWQQYWPLPVGETNITVNRYDIAAGVWGGEQFIDADPAAASAPEIVMTSGGDALVVWQRFGFPDNTLWSNRFDGQSNSWVTPLRVDSDGATYPHKLAQSGLGDAMAIWHIRDPGTLLDNVYVSGFSFGAGQWQLQPDLIGSVPSGNSVNATAIAVSSIGNALALWKENVSTVFDDTIYSNSYNSGTGWGTEQILEFEQASSNVPQVVMFDNGDGLAVWTRNVRSSPVSGTILGMALMASRYSVSSDSWEVAQQVHYLQSYYDSVPRVALNNTGHVMVLWNGDRSPPATDHLLSVGYDSNTGVWGAVQQVDQYGVGNLISDVAVDDAGNAIAVWQSYGKYSVWANKYDVNSDSWGVPKLLENDERGDARDAQVVIDSNGVGIVVWRQSDGSLNHDIYSTRLDPLP